MNVVKQKKEEKEEKIEEKKPKKNFTSLLDEDQVEVKKLDSGDSKDIIKIMKRCAFDVTQMEVESVIRYGFSYGCYVNRILIGVGLAWPANLDLKSKTIKSGEANALYMEDPAVLLAYEGRGIRRILLKTREEAAREKKLQHTISYLYEDLPSGEVTSYIKEAGSQLEKLYLSEDYQFFRTEKGTLAVKKH